MDIGCPPHGWRLTVIQQSTSIFIRCAQDPKRVKMFDITVCVDLKSDTAQTRNPKCLRKTIQMPFVPQCGTILDLRARDRTGSDINFFAKVKELYWRETNNPEKIVVVVKVIKDDLNAMGGIKEFSKKLRSGGWKEA